MKIYTDIDLTSTLESGECFRVYKEDSTYIVVLSDRVISLKRINNYIEVNSNKQDNLYLYIRYFLDLDRDYNTINNILSKNILFKDNINLCNGYKILKQDKFEMLISYIISQNNNVKRIKKTIDLISKTYGEKVIFNNKEYYLFPKYNDIKNITLEELNKLNLGFRSKYILDALTKIKENPLFLEELDMYPTKEALNKLMTIKGIGIKVASCILLFAYSRLDVYPIDTWVKKYFKDNLNISNIKEIINYMNNNFKEYSGLAIQYLYHINRNILNKKVKRCKWCNLNNPIYINYHDNEWSKLNTCDNYLFEIFLLECFQSGLSWECILNKREAFRSSYDNFNIDKIIKYDNNKINELLSNKDIIRNKLKIESSINNAKIFNEIQKEYTSFYNYLLKFTKGKILHEINKTTNTLSDTISKDLHKRGMKYVGSTTIYSYLQAIGIIYSHDKDCFLYK